ncbi:hypothetical protein Pla100_37090 [Neorhodopirellula pilleata]|uniref:Secreted protein n=1 Tax=Neorhodopirellula pilleata TaxID=2714738 RepID=A0A5C6A6W7_9BACT|nr:hypothetical protein Pla100_37090 [Neorhodopirellula pilleata]
MNLTKLVISLFILTLPVFGCGGGGSQPQAVEQDELTKYLEENPDVLRDSAGYGDGSE